MSVTAEITSFFIDKKVFVRILSNRASLRSHKQSMLVIIAKLYILPEICK